MQSNHDCILCSEKSEQFYYQGLFSRNFLKCNNCELVFVDRSSILEFDEEKLRYEDHKNDELSEGYEKFLRRLISPIPPDKGLHILDYGQGPYPMLLKLLESDGYTQISGYDPIFNPDLSLFSKKYDIITCCEVIEHMNDPAFELERISNLLNSGGKFIVSTGILEAEIKFSNWYYIKDNTHINFFSPKSLELIAKKYFFKIVSVEKDLIIFERE